MRISTTSDLDFNMSKLIETFSALDPEVILSLRFLDSYSEEGNSKTLSNNADIAMIFKLSSANVITAFSLSETGFPVILFGTSLNLLNYYCESPRDRGLIAVEELEEDLYPVSFMDKLYGIQCNGNFLVKVPKFSVYKAPQFENLMAGRFLNKNCLLLNWGLESNTYAAFYLTLLLAKSMVNKQI